MIQFILEGQRERERKREIERGLERVGREEEKEIYLVSSLTWILEIRNIHVINSINSLSH